VPDPVPSMCRVPPKSHFRVRTRLTRPRRSANLPKCHHFAEGPPKKNRWNQSRGTLAFFQANGLQVATCILKIQFATVVTPFFLQVDLVFALAFLSFCQSARKHKVTFFFPTRGQLFQWAAYPHSFPKSNSFANESTRNGFYCNFVFIVIL
jgi:hypothetical protein